MNSTVHRLAAFLLAVSSAMLWGQGAQLPKYTVATLPSAALRPTYTVQVTDGANAADCTVGGGTYNVLCVARGNAWAPTGSYPGCTSDGSNGITCTGGFNSPVGFTTDGGSLFIKHPGAGISGPFGPWNGNWQVIGDNAYDSGGWQFALGTGSARGFLWYKGQPGPTGNQLMQLDPNGNLNVGGAITGNAVTIGPHAALPASWTLDTYSPGTALSSVLAGATGCSSVSAFVKYDGTCGDAVSSSFPKVLDFTVSSAPSGIGCSATNPYTCTAFPTGNHICTIYIISGGGGGGSGAVEPSGTNSFGGGGGAAGSSNMVGPIPCNMLGGGTTASMYFSVGAGGAGGAAQTTSGSAGNNGSFGSNSCISSGVSQSCTQVSTSGYVSIQSNGGSNGSTFGSGGTTTTGNGGTTANTMTPYGTCNGANGSSGAGATSSCLNGFSLPMGGGGGGGVNTTGTAGAGGAIQTSGIQTSRVGTWGAGGLTGYTGGTAGGGAGQTPSYSLAITPATFFMGAYGGTGGGGNASGPGGRGGDGMFPGGGGGGGGGAVNGSSSGAGGRGGDGFIRIIVQ